MGRPRLSGAIPVGDRVIRCMRQRRRRRRRRRWSRRRRGRIRPRRIRETWHQARGGHPAVGSIHRSRALGLDWIPAWRDRGGRTPSRPRRVAMPGACWGGEPRRGSVHHFRRLCGGAARQRRATSVVEASDGHGRRRRGRRRRGRRRRVRRRGRQRRGRRRVGRRQKVGHRRRRRPIGRRRRGQRRRRWRRGGRRRRGRRW